MGEARVTWAPAYATAAQLRTYMRVAAVTADADDIANDTDVNTPALDAASRLIDNACSRQFGVTTATARYYSPKWSPARHRDIVSVDDFQSTTSLVVKTDLDGDGVYETTVTLYLKLPVNAAANGRPWTDLEFHTNVSRQTGSLEVTALWGWTSVPPAIKQATLLQASRIVKRRDAPFGVAGSPDMGNELRLLAKLDPDVERMVTAFRRYW